jgi:outer membrane protein assembly complex protein YaeT
MSSSSRSALAAFLLMLLAPAGSACREDGEGPRPYVRELSFEGIHSVDEDDLRSVLATKQGGWLPWSPKPPFARQQFTDDLKRIERYYAEHGFPRARVESLDIRRAGELGLRIRVVVDEGRPTIVERVTLVGFDELPKAHVDELRRRLPVRVGQPRDNQAVATARDAAARELRDHGHAYGEVQALEGPGSAPGRVTLTFAAEPGPETRVGSVTIEGNRSVGEDVIRRQLTFAPGDVFRLGQVQRSQRRLDNLELFQFVNVAPQKTESQPAEVPVTVTVAESKHRRLQLGVGYGSEEKARATVNWRHVNFLGGARTAGIETKWSSLDRGLRASFVEPYFLAPGYVLNVTGTQWWAHEPIYRQRTSGGTLAVTREIVQRRTELSPRIRSTVGLSYIGEYQSYSVTEEALADPSLRDELIALGLDPDTGEGRGFLSGVALDFQRDTTRQPLDRRRGYVVAAHLETAGGLLGGDFRYREITLEGRHFLSLKPGLVWANRASIGALDAADVSKLPFFKRYFLGGSMTLRGWGRYEVSPLEEGFAVGGQSQLLITSELRYRVTDKLGLVAFVDAGNVWLDPWDYDLGDLRYSVGPGVRYETPIGPVRVDLGVQVNPIPGLLINGEPQARRWRIHFSIGQAF